MVREGQIWHKSQKKWHFGVSESGSFSEILLKKMVVWTLETSDSTTGARRVYLAQFNRGCAVSGAQNIHKNSILVRKDATSELDVEAENLHFHYKMWSNETALKQRKKTFFESLWRALVTEIRRNWRKICGFLKPFFRLKFFCSTRLNLPCFFQRENFSAKTPT